MNGPENYREAERIVAEVERVAEHYDADWYAARMAAAQVHATLALAAATAQAGGLAHGVNDWATALDGGPR